MKLESLCHRWKASGQVVWIRIEGEDDKKLDHFNEVDMLYVDSDGAGFQ
jgi:hypothetical protein